MSGGILWYPPKIQISGSAPRLPHYEFCVTNLDQLIGELIRLCLINPAGYMGYRNEHVVKVLRQDNPIDKMLFP